jgi:hypothetical protein
MLNVYKSLLCTINMIVICYTLIHEFDWLWNICKLNPRPSSNRNRLQCMPTSKMQQNVFHATNVWAYSSSQFTYHSVLFTLYYSLIPSPQSLVGSLHVGTIFDSVPDQVTFYPKQPDSNLLCYQYLSIYWYLLCLFTNYADRRIIVPKNSALASKYLPWRESYQV